MIERVMRYVILAVSIGAFVVAGYGYVMAVRLTPDPKAVERIVTWGPDAPASSFSAAARPYRTIMKWGSRVGFVAFLIWGILVSNR
jgi:hypothetical protein